MSNTQLSRYEMWLARQDGQGARTPAQLEEKYNFNARFDEVMRVATAASSQASSGTEANTALAAQVRELATEIELIKAELANKVTTHSPSINTANFTLTTEGEMTANKGAISWWTIDEYGIHQTSGLHGTYTITNAGTTKTYTGYLYYCLGVYGIMVYIFAMDEFDPLVSLWEGDIHSGSIITKIA